MSEKKDFVGKLRAFFLCLFATFFVAFMSAGLIAVATMSDRVILPVLLLVTLIATGLMFWRFNIYSAIYKVILD